MSQQEEELQRDKLTTLGEMAAVLAHEIKNPMNSMIINIEVLRSTLQQIASDSSSPLPNKANRYLGVIESEIKRLEKVISNFLDLATPQEPTKIRVNLNDVIKSVTELMQLEFDQKKIDLVTKLDPHLPRFMGSADQVKQATLNLLINSAQAMKEGGQIELETGFDQRTVFLKISDQGHGIPEELLTRIFSPYFTTKEKGSGLGLAIVRRIVREHGGYVDVENTSNGARFTLVFARNLDDELNDHER